MSVRIMSAVFENQELTSTEKLIMLALADHANDEGKSIYPSQDTLARKTSLARPTINKHIQALVDKGYLRKIRYMEERSNVLELEIIVECLYKGCNGGLHPGVTEDDSNHHINHQLTINNLINEPDLFDSCQKIYETKKGLPVTDGKSFALMVKEFQDQGVTVEDYAAAIEAMDADPKYKGTKPTSYKNWAIGYAREKRNPKKPRKGKQPESVEEMKDRLIPGWRDNQNAVIIDAEAK